MRRPPVAFTVALALLTLTFAAGANARQEGAIDIDSCQTISQPGSYRLVSNLTLPNSTPVCLTITADLVTVDLAGFTMTGPPAFAGGIGTTAIEAEPDTIGVAVRNGSISSFHSGVNLKGSDSIVESLRVVGGFASIGGAVGIMAAGIVRGNTVSEFNGGPGDGYGIIATGAITGNHVQRNRVIGIWASGVGSLVIGNTVTDNGVSIGIGITVACPSNVVENTAVNNGSDGFANNLVLGGDGCNDANNVAP